MDFGWLDKRRQNLQATGITSSPIFGLMNLNIIKKLFAALMKRWVVWFLGFTGMCVSI